MTWTKRCWWEPSTSSSIFFSKLLNNGKTQRSTYFCIQILCIQTKSKKKKLFPYFCIILWCFYIFLLFVVRFYDCRKKERKLEKERKIERKKGEQAREERLHNEAPDFSIMNNHFPHIFFFFPFPNQPNDVNPNPKRFQVAYVLHIGKNANYAEKYHKEWSVVL